MVTSSLYSSLGSREKEKPPVTLVTTSFVPPELSVRVAVAPLKFLPFCFTIPSTLQLNCAFKPKALNITQKRQKSLNLYLLVFPKSKKCIFDYNFNIRYLNLPKISSQNKSNVKTTLKEAIALTEYANEYFFL